MGKKLTKEELDARIYQSTLNTCHYVGGYVNRSSIVTLHCEKHNCTFQTRYENASRPERAHHVCPQCQEEDKRERQVELKCDYCGKMYFVRPSRVSAFNKAHYCSVECHNAAQRMSSGPQYRHLLPKHYGTGDGECYYRRLVLDTRPHRCEVCGWDEDVDILEVHHIDECRKHNEPSNLILLCPICHKKLTTHKYVLTSDHHIIKKVDD